MASDANKLDSDPSPPLDHPAVSVIVPCRNEQGHIEACLKSILNQKEPDGGFEVIVADGMSDDGSREVVSVLTERDHRIRMVENTGLIVSTGLNAAIREARGEIIIRMDAHTQYAGDYVDQCTAVLRETNADNVGGPWLAEGSGVKGRAIAAAFQSVFGSGGARGHRVDYEGQVDTVYLGCWRREIFERIGMFDEDLVRNQDDELNLRLRRAGGKIWQSPRIRSWYHPRDSLKGLFLQYLQYGYWKVRVIQKHRLPASPRHLIPGYFVLTLIVLPLLACFWTPAGALWLGLLLLYSSAVVSASILAARKNGWDLLATLILVFPCYHISYGLGFLSGLFDFGLLRRRARGSFTRLTRRAAMPRDLGPSNGA